MHYTKTIVQAAELSTIGLGLVEVNSVRGLNLEVMKKAAASRRSESDTPWVTPQDPCNCGREDEGETTWMKPEPKRLNDPACNPDVAHPGGKGYSAIHKQIKPISCGGGNTATFAV